MAKKIKTPGKDDDLSVSLVTWPKGKTIDRIHWSQHGAAEFNPGKGAGRFSPIADRAGRIIPTLYGGKTLAVALMETVLHDLPVPCENTPVDLTVLNKLAHSQLTPKEEIKLVDLNPRFMKKHGITQGELLGSTADHYPETRQWAEQIHHSNPEAQGIQWSSKQHGDKALMLFGDRICAEDLDITLDAQSASESADVERELSALANEMALILLSGF
ncbi:RES family NAD+ phosphorylase [Pantoea vagans]|uniref:RES family NAD+ phosphorylase n=1 Tax=Pantoea vagans TaxID=470934 RepID=UPI0028A18468|nr:RES family NAD+ phosphorylase [Pantoea vagans]